MRIGFLIVCLLIPIAARSSEGECKACTKQYSSCLAVAKGIASAIQNCQSDEGARQEAHLKEAYRQALKKLPSESKQELREIQRLWINYRIKNVRFLIGDGRSGLKIEATRSWLELTSMRVGELRYLAALDQ